MSQRTPPKHSQDTPTPVSPHGTSTIIQHGHGQPMNGKTVVVTGATGGIGRATFALNHLAPFLLTNLLLKRLQLSGPARVVTVSSNAQAMGRINFNDLQGEHSYSGARAYNQSKLANLLFTYELDRRLHGTGVTANALHPGLVSTGFGAEDPGRAQRLLVPILRPFMLTTAQGAATSVHIASAPDLAQVSGRFFAKRKHRRSSTASYDSATAAKLWNVSAELTGLTRPADPGWVTSG